MRKTTKLGSVLTRAGGLLALGGVIFLGAGESQARLDPYFLVRSEAYGSVQPRILFLLDNSEPMTERVMDPDQDCNFADCEGSAGPALASRLDGARQAIRGIVQETGAIAEFALMTLDTHAPPAMVGDLSPACAGGTEGDEG